MGVGAGNTAAIDIELKNLLVTDAKLSKEFFFRALAYGFTNVCVKSAEYWIQAISVFGGGKDNSEDDKTTAF